MSSLKPASNSVPLRRYTIAMVLSWTALIGLLLAWDIWQIQKHATMMVLEEARNEFERGEALRTWVTDHGGVYVPVSEHARPNPYLTNVKERDIQTPSGMRLTLMNPAYMVRNFNESLKDKKSIVGHLTSLTITNPINAPDEWERNALLEFRTGKKEVYDFTEVNGEKRLRLMRPVIAEQECMGCHDHQGYGVGDVAGGVSVAVKMDRFERMQWRSVKNELMAFSSIWFLGLLAIGIGSRNVQKRISERDKALVAFSEAESKWRSFMENTPDVVMIVNSSREILYTNLQGGRWEALTRGGGIKDFVDPAYHDKCEKSVKDVFATGMPCSYEAKARNVDDSDLWYLIRMGAVKVGDEIVAASIIATDITSSKRAEENLRMSESAYRALFVTHKRMVENSPAGIILLDKDFRITYENPEIKRIVGVPEGEESLALGMKITDLPSVKETNLPRFMEGMLLGEKIFTEFPFKSIYGKEVFLSVSGVPMFDDEEFVGAVLMLTDITERRQVESERARLVAAINQTEEAVVITGPDGAIEYVNKAFEKVTEYSADEVLGQNSRLLKSGKQDEAFYKNLWDTIKSGKVWKGCFHNRNKSGEIYIEDATITPILNAAGEIVNFVGVKRNITQQLEFEHQVQQAQKLDAIGVLAGGIAHDFNNILSAIIGYTEMAAYSIDSKSEAREYIDDALKASERAKELVKQILTFARYSDEVLAPVEPHLLVKESLKLLRASIPSTISIKSEIDTSSGYILADPVHISQIMVNLCSNAEHAMRKRGGVLDVTLKPVVMDEDTASKHDNFVVGKKYIRFTVSDTGHGMGKATMEQVFEPFFTTKEKGEGTGLGLSVAYGLVKKMNGAIFVASEPDIKTTFTIYLPTVARDWKPAGPTQVFSVKGTERILFVDDEETITRIGKKALSKLGYHVSPYTEPSKALEEFKKDPYAFDLLVTDQTMPEMTGVELVEKIIEIRPDIPVILCSGFSQTLTPETIKELGIREFVLKPVSPNELANIIRQVID